MGLRSLAPVLVCCGAAAVSAGWRAAVRPLWYDELFTYHIAGLGSLAKIREAIQAGADMNPPLFYAATLAGHAIAGATPLGTRLPAVIGFVLLMACVYVFLGRRLGHGYGVLGAALLPLTGSFGYASEGRAYGMLLGWTGLALVAWQRAAEEGRPRWPLGLLAVSLAGALLTHCYSILLFPVIGVGELVRLGRRRALDWPMLAALAVPLAALVTWIPLLASNSKAQLAGPIFDPTLYRMLASYADLAAPVVPVVAVLLAWAFAATRGRRAPGGIPIPAHEWAALGMLALAPVMAFTVATVARGGYFTRYTLPAAIALAAGGAILARLVAGSGWRRSWIPALAASVWLLATSFAGPPPVADTALLERAGGDAPLVILDGQTFLQLDHASSDALARRLVFLLDRESALRYMGTDCYDLGLRLAQPWFPLRGRLVEYADFELGQERFFAYGATSAEHHWLLARVRDEGGYWSVIGRSGNRQLVEVHPYSAGRSEAKGLKLVEESNTSTPSARLSPLTTK